MVTTVEKVLQFKSRQNVLKGGVNQKEGKMLSALSSGSALTICW